MAHCLRAGGDVNRWCSFPWCPVAPTTAILAQPWLKHAEKPMDCLKTSRLHLRPIEPADAALYCRLYADPAVMHHIAEPLSAAAAARAFEATLRQVRRNPPAVKLWILSDAAADVGLLALMQPDAAAQVAELGTMLLVAGQGRGLAAEAQEAVLDQEFGSGDLQRVWTRHAGENRAAARLMLKLGFARMDVEGTECRWQMTSVRWRARRRVSAVVA